MNEDYFISLMRGAGVPVPLLKPVYGQLLFETNNFQSRVSNQDNNYSGINWINKPYQEATRGRQMPRSETGNQVRYYAHFNSPDQWAKDFVRIISLPGSKGRPIEANDTLDYIQRLHANHFFTSDPGSYYRGVMAQLDSIKKNGMNVLDVLGEKITAKRPVQLFLNNPPRLGKVVTAGQPIGTVTGSFEAKDKTGRPLPMLAVSRADFGDNAGYAMPFDPTAFSFVPTFKTRPAAPKLNPLPSAPGSQNKPGVLPLKVPDWLLRLQQQIDAATGGNGKIILLIIAGVVVYKIVKK